jgi:hypothetical protein
LTDEKKNILKAINWNGEGFQHPIPEFPWISDAKLEEGIFVGAQIKEAMNDGNSVEVAGGTEKTA